MKTITSLLAITLLSLNLRAQEPLMSYDVAVLSDSSKSLYEALNYDQVLALMSAEEALHTQNKYMVSNEQGLFIYAYSDMESYYFVDCLNNTEEKNYLVKGIKDCIDSFNSVYRILNKPVRSKID